LIALARGNAVDIVLEHCASDVVLVVRTIGSLIKDGCAGASLKLVRADRTIRHEGPEERERPRRLQMGLAASEVLFALFRGFLIFVASVTIRPACNR